MDQLKDILLKSNSIALCTHFNPDGDTIGCVTALYLGLKKLGKKVKAYTTGPLFEKFHLYLKNLADMEITTPCEDEFELLIFLDCASLKRVLPTEDYKPKHFRIINIDHHPDNTNFGYINVVDPKAAATAEIIYKLLKSLNCEIDQDIATSLYIGIITDTGKFCYSSVTSETHNIISDLLTTGIKPDEINNLVYEQESLNSILLAGIALSKIKSEYDGKLLWTLVTQKLLEETGSKAEDSDLILDLMRLIEKSNVCVLFRESEESIKVSLRSKNLINMNKIAHRFNGGGHERASGCRLKMPIEQAETIIINAIKQELEQFQ